MLDAKLVKHVLFGLALWRIALFVLSIQAVSLLPYQPSFPYAYTRLPLYHLPQWLYSWANFDGVHYLTISERGYVGTALIQAFFPVFPLLMSALNPITHNSVISGLVVANAGLIAMVLVWLALMKLDFDRNQMIFSLMALLLFPTSFFFGAVYGETIFMGLVLASFLASRTNHWGIAGILAGIASATRVVGVLLVPALVCELIYQEYEQQKGRWTQRLRAAIAVTFKKRWPQLLQILLGCGGLLVYMWYLQRDFSDPLYFLHVQSEFGAGRQENLVVFPQVVWRYIKILITYRPIDWKYWALAQEAIVGVLGMIGLLWSFKWVRPSYVIFGLGAFLVPTLTGTFSSMPRYVLVCFPLFLLITQLLQTKDWLKWLYLLGSTLLLMINTVLFIQGYWVA